MPFSLLVLRGIIFYEETMVDKHKAVVVSGMRPTGRLHLGHLHGVIKNWIKLQNDARFDQTYFFVADWHALTTEYDATAALKGNIDEIILDWLAYGVDPKKATVFVQSQVPEHAELHLLLSMITPLGWLERVPSYKDLQQELSNKDLSTYGFLGYPLLQTADVAMYGGTHVPVGQDQVAHIELSREVLRRFNHIYACDVLPEPQPLLTEVPKLPGTDGRKMSKSYDNGIYLSESFDSVRKKIQVAKTDPARQRRTDPGDPEKCPVFDYHRVYTGNEMRQEIIAGCRSASIGCIDCKKKLLSGMEAELGPALEKRQALAAQKDLVSDLLADGKNKATLKARETIAKVRQAMKIAF